MPYIQLKRKDNRPRMLIWVEEPHIIDLTSHLTVPVIDLTQESSNSGSSLASTITSGDSSFISQNSSVASSQWGVLPGDSFLIELSDIEQGDIPRWNLGGGADSQ